MSGHLAPAQGEYFVLADGTVAVALPRFQLGQTRTWNLPFSELPKGLTHMMEIVPRAGRPFPYGGGQLILCPIAERTVWRVEHGNLTLVFPGELCLCDDGRVYEVLSPAQAADRGVLRGYTTGRRDPYYGGPLWRGPESVAKFDLAHDLIDGGTTGVLVLHTNQGASVNWPHKCDRCGAPGQYMATTILCSRACCKERS